MLDDPQLRSMHFLHLLSRLCALHVFIVMLPPSVDHLMFVFQDTSIFIAAHLGMRHKVTVRCFQLPDEIPRILRSAKSLNFITFSLLPKALFSPEETVFALPASVCNVPRSDECLAAFPPASLSNQSFHRLPISYPCELISSFSSSRRENLDLWCPPVVVQLQVFARISL